MKNIFILGLSFVSFVEIANAENLDFEGQVTYAVGSESRRMNQPCTVTVIKNGTNISLSYTVGEQGELYGSKQVNRQTWTGRLLSEEKLAAKNQAQRTEVISLKIASDNSEVEFNRKMAEIMSTNSRTSTLSNLTCTAKLLKQLED